MKNSIAVIEPYKWEGMRVFDDPNVGLVQEPFVGGADTMIDRATAHIPNADRGFLPVFSSGYFPDAQIVLDWVREEGGGQRVSVERKGHGRLVLPGPVEVFPRATRETAHPSPSSGMKGGRHEE